MILNKTTEFVPKPPNPVIAFPTFLSLVAHVIVCLVPSLSFKVTVALVPSPLQTISAPAFIINEQK